jgi:hypothetical protein
MAEKRTSCTVFVDTAWLMDSSACAADAACEMAVCNDCDGPPGACADNRAQSFVR